MLATIFRGGRYPLVALVGPVNTAVIVRQTGEAVFGLVSLVTTLTLLLAFADLGIGAVVTSACSRPDAHRRRCDRGHLAPTWPTPWAWCKTRLGSS